MALKKWMISKKIIYSKYEMSVKLLKGQSFTGIFFIIAIVKQSEFFVKYSEFSILSSRVMIGIINSNNSKGD